MGEMLHIHGSENIVTKIAMPSNLSIIPTRFQKHYFLKIDEFII